MGEGADRVQRELDTYVTALVSRSNALRDRRVDGAATVVKTAATAGTDPVADQRAIGQPLTDRIAHRVELISEVTGCGQGEVFSPEHMGRLIASPSGLRSGTEGLAFTPVINAVDDPEREAVAREAAEYALGFDAGLGRVILASMRSSEQPIVAVVQS